MRSCNTKNNEGENTELRANQLHIKNGHELTHIDAQTCLAGKFHMFYRATSGCTRSIRSPTVGQFSKSIGSISFH